MRAWRVRFLDVGARHLRAGLGHVRRAFAGGDELAVGAGLERLVAHLAVRKASSGPVGIANGWVASPAGWSWPLARASRTLALTSARVGLPAGSAASAPLAPAARAAARIERERVCFGLIAVP